MGDYVSTIRHYGTTDTDCQFSLTSLRYVVNCEYQSELEHRTSKARYIRTTGRSIPQELLKIERRERRIRMIREKMSWLYVAQTS